VPGGQVVPWIDDQILSESCRLVERRPRIAMKMHDSLRNMTVSIEMQYILGSPWIHLRSRDYRAF
jgi:hypothetical protein